jgi:glycosyltransferase involved in cell wall biosynthesis
LVVSFCGDDLLGTMGESGRATLRSDFEGRVFRQLARVCDATITKSDQMAHRLPESCRPRNWVIPNGVDLERFKPVAREQARRTLGWSPHEPVVLFVGNPQIVGKNFALARATVEHIKADLPSARLHVVWGARPEEIPLMMSAADALLVTSRSEGSPNVVKEAMASELPVVSTPVGDVGERIAGVSGCHIRTARPELLGEALVAALRHGRSREARRAVEVLSLSAVARRVLGVYEGVLANRTGAGNLTAGPASRAARSVGMTVHAPTGHWRRPALDADRPQ